MAAKNPYVGDVVYNRANPDTSKWERIEDFDDDTVETRDFRGDGHIYRRNDWHEIDWVWVYPSPPPPSPPADAVTIPCAVTRRQTGAIAITGLQGFTAEQVASGLNREVHIATVPVSVPRSPVPVLPAVVAEPNKE